ncbi:MAG TPA: hypothetical protein DCZ03_07105 [Gammaproteobacteria bacterium]|nr:hypothetical protein [Gammaproteobacteria bacterium]
MHLAAKINEYPRGFESHNQIMIRTKNKFDLISYYYFGTPLFMLLDLLWGYEIRLSETLSAPQQIAYYGFCVFCAWVCWYKPRFHHFAALVESSVNLTLLLGTVLLVRYDNIIDGKDMPHVGLTMENILPFLLSASILIMVFKQAESGLQKSVS